MRVDIEEDPRLRRNSLTAPKRVVHTGQLEIEKPLLAFGIAEKKLRVIERDLDGHSREGLVGEHDVVFIPHANDRLKNVSNAFAFEQSIEVRNVNRPRWRRGVFRSGTGGDRRFDVIDGTRLLKKCGCASRRYLASKFLRCVPTHEHNARPGLFLVDVVD